MLTIQTTQYQTLASYNVLLLMIKNTAIAIITNKSSSVSECRFLHILDEKRESQKGMWGTRRQRRGGEEREEATIPDLTPTRLTNKALEIKRFHTLDALCIHCSTAVYTCLKSSRANVYIR